MQTVAQVAEYVVVGTLAWFALLFPFMSPDEPRGSGLQQIILAFKALPYAPFIAGAVVYLTGGIVSHGGGFVLRFFEMRILGKVYGLSWGKSQKKLSDLYHQHQETGMLLQLKLPHMYGMLSMERHLICLAVGGIFSSLLLILLCILHPVPWNCWVILMSGVFFIGSAALWCWRQNWLHRMVKFYHQEKELWLNAKSD